MTTIINIFKNISKASDYGFNINKRDSDPTMYLILQMFLFLSLFTNRNEIPMSRVDKYIYLKIRNHHYNNHLVSLLPTSVKISASFNKRSNRFEN